MKPLVIYHGNCADGFTSAWLANQYFAGSMRPSEWHVDLHAGVYGDAPPDVDGRNVYILDFSYPPDVLIEMSKNAHRITVIDHHESAVRRYEGILMPDNVSLLMDVGASGAYLTAKYFWPNIEPDDMVKMVDDRDRWQFKLPNSRPFSAGMFSYYYSLENWNHIANYVPEVIDEGHAIERKHHKDIKELLEVCANTCSHGDWLVAVANLPYIHASDAGHKMLEIWPGADFAATYFIDKKGMHVFSLRSRKGGPNVAMIAEEFGGGGHPNASGFKVKAFPFKPEW